MLYICAKFHEIILNGIKVIDFYRENYKGEQFRQNAGGATVVNLCTSSVMLYISTKICEIISNGIKVTEWTRFLY